MKKTLALILALCLALPCFAVAETTEPTYTYNDSVSTLSTNWNPHTYKTLDEDYPSDFLSAGLYTFLFNDELNPKEGMDPYAGYVIVPEMAAELPVDVTAEVRDAHPEFGIPASAEKGYAYKIALNPNATWSDGTPINADTYVESMKRLLDPKLQNYRATDYTSASNSFVIANGEAYANSGRTVKMENGAQGDAKLTMEGFIKGEDGAYTVDGAPAYIAIDYPLEWISGNTLKDYVENYGESYFDITNWEALVAKVDDKGLIPLTEENLALFTPVITGNPAWGETVEQIPEYLVYEKTFPEMDFANVGIMKTGDYEITLVLGKSLSGFYLLYSLGGNWIVKTDLYDACLSENAGVWTNTYNTSLETCASYGPYVMTYYQTDKQMKFEKNPNWYGWTDGKHVYVDPTDGETYPMYQTTHIVTDVVAEAATRKQMFLNGQLIGYGLQTEDMDTYRTSDYAHVTPGTTIFFLILNGYRDMMNQREEAADFDKTTTDLQTMGVMNFRKAMALVYDRVDFCNAVQPSRSAGYSLIGTGYIADPDIGLQYRDTDVAKQVLCDFYSVDVSKYNSLDEAVDSITGYDPVKAKELFGLAFQEALEAGYITDADNDGISDQTVTMTYSVSTDSDFMTKTINYLNTKVQEVAAGTPFDGKIQFVKSAPLGNDWSDAIREGRVDTVLGGWNGSQMDPYGIVTAYTNPDQAYAGKWWNAKSIELTIKVNGEDITMSIYDWAECLNGATMTVGEKDYNFGADQAEQATRLEILAALEGAILQTYDYIPMIQDGSLALLSQKVFYVVEDYNPVMGRGGIRYLKYNYNDAEWDAYVAECGGTLTY